MSCKLICFAEWFTPGEEEGGDDLVVVAALTPERAGAFLGLQAAVTILASIGAGDDRAAEASVGVRGDVVAYAQPLDWLTGAGPEARNRWWLCPAGLVLMRKQPLYRVRAVGGEAGLQWELHRGDPDYAEEAHTPAIPWADLGAFADGAPLTFPVAPITPCLPHPPTEPPAREKP